MSPKLPQPAGWIAERRTGTKRQDRKSPGDRSPRTAPSRGGLSRSRPRFQPRSAAHGPDAEAPALRRRVSHRPQRGAGGASRRVLPSLGPEPWPAAAARPRGCRSHRRGAGGARGTHQGDRRRSRARARQGRLRRSPPAVRLGAEGRGIARFGRADRGRGGARFGSFRARRHAPRQAVLQADGAHRAGAAPRPVRQGDGGRRRLGRVGAGRRGRGRR